jgi:hypothetical protein
MTTDRKNSAGTQYADTSSQSPSAAAAAPTVVIVIAVVTFVGLLVVAGFFVGVGAFHNWVDARHLGRLPVGIVWFAAIGGSLVSLKGIFKHHNNDWKVTFNAWHMLRPWTGVVMGVLGAFFLLVATELATVSPNGVAAGRAPQLNPDIYYVAAFIAGFAEESFRDLVERLTRTIFGPGANSKNGPESQQAA